MLLLKDHVKVVNRLTSANPTVLAHAIDKGGNGKTAMTFFHAIRLGEQSKRVLVIDFDPQEDISKRLLGPLFKLAKEQLFVSSDLIDPEKNQQAIQVCSSPLFDNVDVIVSSENGLTTKNSQVDSAGEGLTGEERKAKVNRFLDYITRLMNDAVHELDYDYIFFDLPPSTSFTQIAALMTLDVLFIPLENSQLQISHAEKTLRKLSVGAKKYNRSHVKAFVYLNRASKLPQTASRLSASQVSLNTIRSRFGDYLLDVEIPQSTAINEATLENRPVWRKPPSGQAHKVGLSVRRTIDKMTSLMERG